MKKTWSALFILSIMLLMNLVYAENLEIQIKNNYLPGENINFKIILYDDAGNKIEGKISFVILDYYTEIIQEGMINSEEEVIFKLPENAWRGYWAIIAKYNDIEKKELFIVGELEKANIELEGDKLIVTNAGNVPYTKSLLIAIGDNKETILVPLEVGQKKELRLTAPDGNYDVKVNDGSQREDITFSGVSLTGNVVGLESVSGSFWSKYPLVTLFLISLFLVLVVISSLKIHEKFTNKKGKRIDKK
jgi:hypothetical protein